MVYQIIIFVLVIIIITLIYFLLFQRNKYLTELLNKDKKLVELSDKYSLCLKDKIRLAKDLSNYEEKEYETNNGFDTLNGKIEKDPIYEGKKALIGDYITWSAKNTKRVLQSLGFSVDIVPNSSDVIQKIKCKEHYDIIFSNNIYQDGTGPECLQKLKKIEGFSTPVVIHTITKNERDYFVDVIGFDDYIVKPVTQENVKPILKRLLNT